MTIKILEYDQVDPLGILNLNLLSLNYALTPERVELIRKLDPRVFPFFGLYAVEDNCVVGQVGVYRLPMISTEGPEDVGGISAVCTHPAYSNRGIASQLINEAHSRMRAEGLRFSTLGTARHRIAYSLYRHLGYMDVFTPQVTFAASSKIPINLQMWVNCGKKDNLSIVDELFKQIARDYLGFSLRHENFFFAMAETGEVSVDDMWLVWNKDELVGYLVVRIFESILVVDHLLLKNYNIAAAAVSALVNKLQVSYIQIRIDHPSVAKSLILADFQLPQHTWNTFMIKPLIPSVTFDSACDQFGIGTDRFLISKFDVT